MDLKVKRERESLKCNTAKAALAYYKHFQKKIFVAKSLIKHQLWIKKRNYLFFY